MANSPTYLTKILPVLPRAAIYTRLGFKKKTTKLDPSDLRETDRLIDEAASLIVLQGAFFRSAVVRRNEHCVELSETAAFESVKLAAFLRDCREALLMGATAGAAIMDAIGAKTLAGDMKAAVVYDATASELADAALNWMMDFVNGQLRREGKVLLPRRFSAGYADFGLQNQKILHARLDLAHLGIAITKDCILIPEKSVTAVGGILG